MKKTKYRYKCMVCGTEVVSGDTVSSCDACGSDDLAKFEILPVTNVVKKQPRRRKSAPSLTSDVNISSIRDFLPAPPMPKSIPPYRRPSVHISSPPPPPPPPPTTWKRIYCILKDMPWKTLTRIIAPFAIGGMIYGIVKLFL